MNTDQFIMQRLLGRLWHVTSLERFQGIKVDGFVRPEPEIPDADRWSTRMGSRWYPFVRHIGGFSLFDFPIGFDLASYRQRCPSSSLEAFIPYRPEWGHAVWLEIDEERQREALLDGPTVWTRCEREGQGRRCMPYVEAAHIGDMPVSSIRSAHLVERGNADWKPIS